MGNIITPDSPASGATSRNAAAPAKSSKFNMATFRAVEHKEVESTTQTSQSEIPVRKPGAKNFFQSHPDPNFCLFGVPALEDTERNMYLLQPGYEVPGNVAQFVFSANLATCITHRGGIFIWGFRTSSNGWSNSAHSVLRTARSQWVRIKPDMEMSCYRVENPPSELASMAPKWTSTMEPEQLFDKAFTGRLIDSDSHPVILQLQGKA